MKVNYVTKSNISEVELELFREVSSDVKAIDSGVKSNVNDIFNKIFDIYYHEDCFFLKVIALIDSRPILSEIKDGEFFLLDENPLKLKKGEVVICCDRHFFRLEKGLLDIDYLKSIKDKLTLKNFYKKNIPKDSKYQRLPVSVIDMDDVVRDCNDVFLKKVIEKNVNIVVESVKKQIEDDKRKEKKFDDNKNEARKKYEKDSVCEFIGLSVNKNKAVSEKREISLHTNFNEKFSYEKLYDIVIEDLENRLLSSKISYTRNDDNKITYSVTFEEVSYKERIRINGRRIKSRNPRFLLDKILKGATDEQIKVMNSLTGIRLKLMETFNIIFYRNNKKINLDINFIPISKNIFNVTFIDKTEEIQWKTIKELFLKKYKRAYGKMEIILNADILFLFLTIMKISKQELFDYLKQAVMLDSLGGEE